MLKNDKLPTAYVSNAIVSPNPGGRFDVLDGLRGVAAFFVVFRHFPGAELRHPWPLSFFAVDFFFILSGFVLAPGLTANRKPVEVLRYMIWRGIRVWPTYLLGAAVAIFAQCWSPQEINRASILAQIPGTITLLPLFKGQANLIFPLIGPAWSLFAEYWIANLLFAIFYSKLGQRGIAAVALVAAALMIALTLVHGNADFGFTWHSLPATFVRVIFSFSLGCFLRSIRGINAGVLPAIFGPMLAIGLAFLFWLPFNHSPTFQILMLLFVLPTIVWAGSQVRHSRSTHAVCRALGEMSYPLYTLHAGLGMLVSTTLGLFEITFPHFTIVFAILFVPLAWFIAKFYDEPLRALLTSTFQHNSLLDRSRLSQETTSSYVPDIGQKTKRRGAA